MHLHRRILTFMLVCLMAASAVSCGGETVEPADGTTAGQNDETTTAPETTDGTPQTGTTTPESTALSDDLGEYDFNKRNFNIVYSAEQLGERWPYPSDEQTGDILNDAVYKRETNVEERFNVDITWSSTGGVNSEVAKALNASVMAGDQSYQLAVTTCTAASTR